MKKIVLYRSFFGGRKVESYSGCMLGHNIVVNIMVNSVNNNSNNNNTNMSVKSRGDWHRG